MLTPAQTRLDYDQHLATFSAALLGAALLRPQPQAPVPRQSGWKIVTERPSTTDQAFVDRLCPGYWYTSADLQSLLGPSRQHTHTVVARLCYWGLLRREGTRYHYRWQRVEAPAYV